jgi:hypothetical protein
MLDEKQSYVYLQGHTTREAGSYDACPFFRDRTPAPAATLTRIDAVVP